MEELQLLKPPDWAFFRHRRAAEQRFNVDKMKCYVSNLVLSAPG